MAGNDTSAEALALVTLGTATHSPYLVFREDALAIRAVVVIVVDSTTLPTTLSSSGATNPRAVTSWRAETRGDRGHRQPIEHFAVAAERHAVMLIGRVWA